MHSHTRTTLRGAWSLPTAPFDLLRANVVSPVSNPYIGIKGKNVTLLIDGVPIPSWAKLRDSFKMKLSKKDYRERHSFIVDSLKAIGAAIIADR